MANSADPDQLASSDLHCLQRQRQDTYISWFSMTKVNFPCFSIFNKYKMSAICVFMEQLEKIFV